MLYDGFSRQEIRSAARRLRIEMGMSHADVARMVGCAASTIGLFEQSDYLGEDKIRRLPGVFGYGSGEGALKSMVEAAILLPVLPDAATRGKAVKSLRLTHGLSQKDLALKMGLSVAAINKIESGISVNNATGGTHSVLGFFGCRFWSEMVEKSGIAHNAAGIVEQSLKREFIRYKASRQIIEITGKKQNGYSPQQHTAALEMLENFLASQDTFTITEIKTKIESLDNSDSPSIGEILLAQALENTMNSILNAADKGTHVSALRQKVPGDKGCSGR